MNPALPEVTGTFGMVASTHWLTSAAGNRRETMHLRTRRSTSTAGSWASHAGACGAYAARSSVNQSCP